MFCGIPGVLEIQVPTVDIVYFHYVIENIT